MKFIHLNFTLCISDESGFDWQELQKILLKDDRDALEIECVERGDRMHNIFHLEHAHEKKTALHAAIDYQAIDCLEYLLNKCSLMEEINYPDAIGQSPLHYAVQLFNNQLTMLPCITNLCATNSNYLPIYHSNLPLLVKKLLMRGAFVNQRNCQGETPLHCLVKKCMDCPVHMHHVLIKTLHVLLSDPYTEVDAIDGNGCTPLNSIMHAVSDEPDIVSKCCVVLIGNGAHATSSLRYQLTFQGKEKIKKGKSKAKYHEFSELLHHIIGKDDQKMKAHFHNNSRKQMAHWQKFFIGNQILTCHLISEFSCEIVESFLYYGGNPWAINTDNELPLNTALKKGDYKSVDIIIQYMKIVREEEKLDLRKYTFVIFRNIFQKLNKSFIPININYHDCLHRVLQDDIRLEELSSSSSTENSPVALAVQSRDLAALKIVFTAGS